MLFLMWRQTGADPYRTYNGLGSDYRPLHEPGADPRPPRFPQRVKAFLYGCARFSREMEKTDMENQARLIAKVTAG